MVKKNKQQINLQNEEIKILHNYYYDKYIPRPLYDTKDDEYDFIAADSFLSGIIYQALKGKNISQFSTVDDYIDSEYKEAKNRMLDINLNMANHWELLQYFEAYEKAVAVLQKIIK